jgi:RNA-binding protein required for 60S ribosomal subunit biogenesis
MCKILVSSRLLYVTQYLYQVTHCKFCYEVLHEIYSVAVFYRNKSCALIFQICEIKNCNKCILFEGRLKRDLYMWMANIPNGPSAKFLVENGNSFFLSS